MVELRSVPDCPNLQPVRAAVYACLAELSLPADVIERVGEFPSPSVLVDGVDVMPDGGDGPTACRLDLPTAEDIRAALREVIHRRAMRDHQLAAPVVGYGQETHPTRAIVEPLLDVVSTTQGCPPTQ